MNIALQELNDYIANSLGEMLIEAEIRLDELIITVNRESIVDTLKFLPDDANCHFKQLKDVCGPDYPEQEDRFCLSYNLLSMTHNFRIRVMIWTDESTPVASVTSITR